MKATCTITLTKEWQQILEHQWEIIATIPQKERSKEQVAILSILEFLAVSRPHVKGNKK